MKPLSVYICSITENDREVQFGCYFGGQKRSDQLASRILLFDFGRRNDIIRAKTGVEEAQALMKNLNVAIGLMIRKKMKRCLPLLLAMIAVCCFFVG